MREMREVVLVHGAWHGGWCWDPLVTALSAKGISARAVDLPLTTLADDAAVVRQAVASIAAAGDEVVLVGHSYGGAVVSEAGTEPGVAHVVYVAAFVPDRGESVMGLAQAAPPGTLGAAMQFADDGSVSVDESLRVAVFYADCDPEAAAAAAGRLRPMQAAPFGAPIGDPAWRHVPSTYVVCTRDEAVDPDLQRTFAARCTNTVTLDAGHSPFLSQPGALAEVVAAI